MRIYTWSAAAITYRHLQRFKNIKITENIKLKDINIWTNINFRSLYDFTSQYILSPVQWCNLISRVEWCIRH